MQINYLSFIFCMMFSTQLWAEDTCTVVFNEPQKMKPRFLTTNNANYQPKAKKAMEHKIRDEYELVLHEDWLRSSDSQDGFEIYIKEIHRVLQKYDKEKRLLNYAQEQNLVRIISLKEPGWERAQQELIERNLLLVISVASRYFFLVSGERSTLTKMDLIQAGNEGLIKAAGYFLPGVHSFATYAIYHIRERILYEISSKNRTVKIPKHSYRDVRQFIKVQEILSSQEGVFPSTEKVAELLGWTLEKAKYIEPLTFFINSLDFKLKEGEEFTLQDIVADPSALSHELQLIKNQNEQLFKEAFFKLKPADQKLLSLKFGFGTTSEQEITNIEIAKLEDTSLFLLRRRMNAALKGLKNIILSNPKFAEGIEIE